jgi:phospholipase/lecithinase/hemolysin
MTHAFLAAGLLAGALAAGPVHAAPHVDPFTSFWALGDSLTDNGNVFAVAPGAIPSPPYFNGRVSSGPTYAEYIAADFAAQGKPTGNLAFAGALAATDGDLIPDLAAQAFAPFPIYADGQAGLTSRAGQFGLRPLVSLFFGSNDVLGALALGGDPVAAAANAAQQVLDAMGGLALAGVRDFVVLTLPDFAQTPRLNGQPAPIRALATAASLQFNAALAGGIPGLQPGISVTQVNVFSALGDVIADPGAYGLSNTTDSCLSFGVDGLGNPTITGVCADPASYVFFDEIHPTGPVHAALADAARAALTPVPLPAAGWALLAGLAGLVATARRRAA